MTPLRAACYDSRAETDDPGSAGQAGVAELAYALVLGTSGKPCGFKSHRPYQSKCGVKGLELLWFRFLYFLFIYDKI